jgi:hypothetical protein
MFGNSKDGKNINKNTLATQHETELERRKNIVADAMFEATGLKCNAAITNPNENYCYKYHWTGGMDYIMDSDNEMVCTNIVYELLNSDTQIFMSRPEKKVVESYIEMARLNGKRVSQKMFELLLEKM